VFIEVFRALASRQRMFGEMQLAEGVGFEPTIRFQVCTLFQWLVDERANVISSNASISRPKARISDA
jgi:hypothetical protein